MPEGSACELIVVVEASEGAAARLAAALGAVAVASVVISAPGGKALDTADARSLVALAQEKGAAALIENDVRLARTLRADGVHLSVASGLLQAYEEAREVLGTRGAVGVYAGKSRHDAMTLAERGAAYVAFGAPAAAKDQDAARARRHELVEWWAEIFEVPCVALDVVEPDDAAALAIAGADFVAVTLEAGLAPADGLARITTVRRAIEGRS